jgi:GTP-binding protein
VGRPNVGKSTLVNRLFGRRHAIADRAPGVTRDRLEVETTWRGRRFALVDTAGQARSAAGVEALAADQAARAASEADVVLLVVDAQAGVTEEDAVLARRLRGARAPVVVVANKVDTAHEESDALAFHALGLGEPVVVSALHGRSAGDLLDRLTALLPSAPEEVEGSDEPRFAIVGRPNVGKSSLFNRLVGEDRVVVYEDAGTTRDAVDARVEWPSGPVRFVDTAGLRRAGRLQGVDYYSFVRASEAIERADVAAAVIDASEGLTSDDKRIVSNVIEAGRAVLIVANKWDLVQEKDRLFKDIQRSVATLAGGTAVRTSALTGQGVNRVPPALLQLRDRWSSRAPTARVNEIVRQAQSERPPPRSSGRIRYATQVASRPPTFVLFGGPAPDTGYRRYIENRLRATLDLEGVPIRLHFRRRRTSA